MVFFIVVFSYAQDGDMETLINDAAVEITHGGYGDSLIYATYMNNQWGMLAGGKEVGLLIKNMLSGQ